MRHSIEILWLTGALAAMPIVGCSAGNGDARETGGGQEHQTTAPADSANPANPAMLPATHVADEDVQALVSGNSQFALDLYRYLRSEEGNLFFSPYSISTALGMTYVGARTDTEAQMKIAMHFDLPQETLHPAFGALAGELHAASAGDAAPIELAIANRLWGHETATFLPSFLQTIEAQYAGGFERVNFHEKEAARQRINGWIAQKTREKIPELLKPEHLEGDVRLVLTNAIYFKGDWAEQFKEEHTRDAAFFTAGDGSIDTPMMNQTHEFPLYQSDALQALELPYAGDRMSMVVLLPRERDGLAGLEEVLTLDNLTEWMSGLHEQKVRVTLPKFRMRYAKELTNALKSLGMPSAFDASADFSGFTGMRDLFITAVAHEAYVDVNEEGTEAAGATGVVVGRSAVVGPPPVFRADHPFIFLIRDRETGAILFMGRVSDPTAGNRGT